MAQLVPDIKDLRAEQELFGHPIYRREAATVAPFIASLRSASNPGDFRELHRTLLGNFIGCQRFLEQLSREKDEAKAAIRDEKKSGREGMVRALSRKLADIDLDRRAGLAVLSLYRGLGDALTWVLLEYRRAAITLLGEGTRVDRLPASAGLEAELAEIDRLWEGGHLAIHADLTTCLQHGDLLVVTGWEPRRFDIQEVKASGRQPSSAQIKRLARLKELLNRGRHPTADDGRPLIVADSEIGFVTHLVELPEVLARAREESYAWRRLGPFLGIEVYDETNPAGLTRDEFQARHREFREQSGLWPADDYGILRYSTSSRRIRDRRHNFSLLAPVTLFPLAVEDVASIAHGRFDVIATLNAEALEGELADRGIQASVARGREAAGKHFLVAERDGKAIRVPAPVREHVLVELLAANTLLDQIEWMLDASGAPGAPSAVVAYADEQRHWTSYPAS